MVTQQRWSWLLGPKAIVPVVVVTFLALAGPARSEVSYSAAALTGQPAPGAAGAVYTKLRAPLLNDAGQVAFRAELASGMAFDWGILSGSPGAMQIVARSGEPAPGVPAGFVHGSRADDPYALTATGSVLYSASLAHPQMSSEGWGLWATGGAPQYVVGRTIIPPGLDEYIENLLGASMNSGGTVALTATLAGPNIDDSNYMGIWAGPAGNLQPVARMGQQAAGAPPGVVYSDYHMDIAFSPPVLSKGTQNGFSGYTALPGAGSVHNAAWAGQPGALFLLAQEGDPAPGFPAGTTIAGVGLPVMAPSGQIAFDVALPGGQRAIYSGTADNFQVAVRSGDPAPGLAGASFAFLHPPVVNSSGRLAFMASATSSDGTNPGTEFRGIWTGTRDALQLVALSVVRLQQQRTTAHSGAWILRLSTTSGRSPLVGCFLSSTAAASTRLDFTSLTQPLGCNSSYVTTRR